MTLMQRPRVLLADDHVMVAQGLCRLLEGEVEIVATVNDGAELVKQAQEHRPDIIIADVSMPVMNGMDATREIRKAHSAARILILTGGANSAEFDEARLAGADVFLTKDRIEELACEILQLSSR